MKKTALTKKYILTTGLALGIFTSIAAGVLIHHTYAQETSRIMTIVPPAAEYTLNPGDKREGELKMINDSDQPLTFTATPQDFIVEDTHGTPTILPPNTLGKRFSAAAWIGLVPDSFTVAPHQKQVIHFYLQVPSDARPGGHYAAIVYNPTETLGVKGSGAAVQTQLGTLFSIGVNGPITEQAIVSKFFSNTFQEFGPVNIMTQITNYSDIHIKPKGNITITDIFGHQVAQLPLDQHNIFPTAARDYVNIFDGKFLLGKYTAKFLAYYGKNNNLPLMATITFWIFPWKIALIIVLLLVALVLGWLIWEKRRFSKHIKDHHSDETPVK